MLTPDICKLIEENTLGLVATITPEGSPAVSPKGTMLVLDERTIAFSDIRSPGTARNLRHNPAVELNYIDVLRRKAARVKGRARYLEKGTQPFNELAPRFQAKWQDLFPRMRGFVVVDVEKAELVRSPIYDASGADEGEIAKQWLAMFAERVK